MADVKHTPGPWVAKWSKYREGEYLVQTRHPSNRVIARFDDDGDGAGEQSIADAHLIAAAPDLLDALSELTEMLRKEAPGTPLNNHRFDALGLKANNAIAKATGTA